MIRNDKLKIISKVIIFFLFSILTFSVYSQSADTLTLEECKDLALKNSQKVKNKNLDKLINRASIKETRANLYPEIKLKGSYQYYLDLPKSLVSSELFGSPSGQYSFAQFQVSQNVNASADFSWQIYNPAILAALKINKFNQSLTELSLKQEIENLIYDISATYYNIQINELQIDLTRSNLENLRKNLELTTQLYSKGFALKSDIDNITVSIVNLETILSDQTNGLNQLYNLIKVYMALPLETPIKVDNFKNEDTVFENLTLIDFDALLNRTDYTSVKQSEELLEFERESVKAGFMPSLNIVGSFGYSGADTQFDFMRSYGNRWVLVNFIQLNLEVPIFNGFKKKSQLEKNRIEKLKTNNTLEDLKNTFQMEIANASNNYNHYLKELEYQSKNLDLANKLYSQKQLQYQNSIATLSDVITVENTLKLAQTNYLNTLVQLRIALLDLKKAKGQLLN